MTNLWYTCAYILSPLLACIHCIHVHIFTPCFKCILVHVFTPCFQCIPSPTYVHRLRQPNDCCSMKCFHELFTCKYSCAYHVHILLHTVLSLFLLKFVVHICMNTPTIVCMYSLHACSYNHSMFSVHVNTNISASYTTTDRLRFH